MIYPFYYYKQIIFTEMHGTALYFQALISHFTLALSFSRDSFPALCMISHFVDYIVTAQILRIYIFVYIFSVCFY